MIVGIIGGGASGMAAALAAAKNPNTQVILLERQARLGRKLLATGNGRCNLTNLHTGVSRYHGNSSHFVCPALENLDVAATLQWFESLGLLTVAEDSGKVYPYSDQANSVVDVLRLALQQENIEIRTGYEVTKVRRCGNSFELSDGESPVRCDKLIIACGGLAGSKLGGSLWGYKLLKKFGHSSTPLRPALVQLKTSWPGITALKGVRANCTARIFREDTLFAESTGEVQFTEYGLSGPVIFEISRDVCYGGGSWVCRLDLLPQLSEEKLYSLLCQKRYTVLNADELLTGILHNRLGRVVTKEAGISGSSPISHLSDEALQAVCRIAKDFAIDLTETLGMDSAQVTAGGVVTDEFDPKTMESRLIPGLFACGEVLDIDGDCGGFNLQWAWSSGYAAGSYAGKERL